MDGFEAKCERTDFTTHYDLKNYQTHKWKYIMYIVQIVLEARGNTGIILPEKSE